MIPSETKPGIVPVEGPLHEPVDPDAVYAPEDDESGNGDPAYHHRHSRDRKQLRSLGKAASPLSYLQQLGRGR